jgi:hypothetical protein
MRDRRRHCLETTPNIGTLQESRPLGEAYLSLYVSNWRNQGIYWHLLEEKMWIEWSLVPFGAQFKE